MTNPVWLVFVLMAILLWSATSLLYKAGARSMEKEYRKQNCPARLRKKSPTRREHENLIRSCPLRSRTFFGE